MVITWQEPVNWTHCIGCGIEVNYIYASGVVPELPPMCQNCATIYVYLNLVEWDNEVERFKTYRSNRKLPTM
jgi:hypothetical protein